MKAHLALSLITSALLPVACLAGEAETDFDRLKKEVEDLRKKVAARAPVESSAVGKAEALVDNKFGANAAVTSKQGKLTIGGLLQVWYYSIQNDNVAWVDVNAGIPGPGGAGGYSSNEVADNDSFRIRRAELKFTMDIHENVTAVVMIDPAREAASFPGLPTNQTHTPNGSAFYNAGFEFTDFAGAGSNIGHVNNEAVRNGSGEANRLLQDAYINYHGIVPHHDFTVGQFKRRLGEEGTRDSGQLDFAERAMITQLADLRDLGFQVHGTWWDDRLQYWLGTFNGAGTAFQQRQNRSDDNDEKDFVGTILVRPLWKDETWGSIELGYSLLYGTGGEAGGRNTGSSPVDGLNRNRTIHVLQYAWASYFPGGPVRGWWLRGEWGLYRDRFAPGDVASPVAPGTSGDPAPFSIQGWYFSTGYKLSDSIWADGLDNGGTFKKHLLRPMEFTFRYETMQNLFYLDLVNPEREHDVFKTQVYTAGINYYIKGHNAKLQINYNWALEEDRVDTATDFRQVREVRNNNLLVNFQVSW